MNMRRILTTTLFLLGVTQAASVYSWFVPSTTDITVACKSGEQAANTNTFDGLAKYSTEVEKNVLRFQTALGGISSICYSDARQLNNMRSVETLKNAGTPLIFLSGSVSELSSAQTWAVAIDLADANNNLLMRLKPVTSETGSTSSWKVNCTKYGCTWSGTNYYYFDAKDSGVQAALTKTVRMVIVINRGKGLENFHLSPAQFPNLQ